MEAGSCQLCIEAVTYLNAKINKLSFQASGNAFVAFFYSDITSRSREVYNETIV